MKKDSKRIQKLKEKSANLSVAEGSVATVAGSFGSSYITPFALALNATNTQVGFLNSFSGLLGPFSQWMSSRLIEKHSRRKVVLFGVLIEALMWLPMIVLAYLFHKGIWQGYLPLMLIVFYSFHIIFGSMTLPAWFSWMGDIVEEKHRGNYFSRRNRITGAIGIVLTLTAAFFLDFFKTHSMLLLGFGIFFFIAFTARIISREFFKHQYEPKIKLEKNYYFSFWEFIKKAPNNNFGKFTMFRASLSFAVSIAGPFFAVYMLRDLGFSYTLFITIVLAAGFFSMIAVKAWGKFADTHGNYEVMKITSILVALIPLLWLFSKNPIFLIFGPQLASGLGWGGFNLAANNFIYDSVTPQRRGLCVAYYNMLNGIGVFIGAGLGGLLAKYIVIDAINVLLILFAISGIIRLIVIFTFLPRFKEIREITPINEKRIFKHIISKTVYFINSYQSHTVIPLKKVSWKDS